MKKLTSKDALALLLDCQGMALDDNWIEHSIYVGILAGMIAEILNLDSDYIRALSFIHDIGKRYGWERGDSVLVHAVNGYNYIKLLGYDDIYANICLVHSFLNNNINCLANDTDEVDISGSDFAYYKQLIQNHENTIQEEIIQLCDLMCTSNGVVGMEKRLIDLLLRKGVHKHTEEHLRAAMSLKQKFESMSDELKEMLNKENIL